MEKMKYKMNSKNQPIVIYHRLCLAGGGGGGAEVVAEYQTFKIFIFKELRFLLGKTDHKQGNVFHRTITVKRIVLLGRDRLLF